jgi:hypothetical protein
MKKGKIKSGFYKKYEAEKKNQSEKPEKEDKVIVINQSEKQSMLSIIFHGIAGVFRVIVYILLFILSSIGLTALINADIRNSLLELVNLIK